MAKKSTNKNFLLLFVTVLVTNYGYAQEIFCSTLEGVVSGHQIYYVGSMLTIMFLVLTVIALCGIVIKRLLKNILFFLALLLIICVCTVSRCDLYYTDLYIYQSHGLSLLGHGYGPLHNLLFIYLAAVESITIILLVKSIITKRHLSIRTLVGMFVMIFFGTICYIFPRIFHIPFEIIPLAYTVMDIFTLVVVNHISMYDMSESMLNVFEERQDYGYITFDINKRFMGCNDMASFYFPELKEIPIDSKIKVQNGKIFSEVIPWIERWEENNNEKYSVSTSENAASCSLSYITAGKRKIGFLIEMKDETETNKYLDFLSKYNLQLENNVEQKSKKIQHIQDSIITGMASMVESRDNSTGGHIKRTSQGVNIFMEQLKTHKEFKWVTDEFCLNMIKAAPMHDLGKIAVDDSILRKPSKFTEEEFNEMKKHSSEGAKIVYGVLGEVDDEDFKIIAMNVAHYHHERWDGSGYPTGKCGEDIPIEARIMALCDVFDALVTKRCYKEAFTYEEAFDIIEKGLGTHFDPVLGKVFLECREELEKQYTLDSLMNNAVSFN